ncbi:hypothetical protein HRE53_04010 [Acaryochloris sp. 'Moss Beach']|uniref:DUF6717 family protein n=1 Tax=Acaryochloris sp. 'Moss Beach' TaxID=2740837 RepID=UPI001F1C263B|nr:DUF6717 family protein [Acaryochloris sp. 'Moss Beach']UJB70300.1 hypothetical protein HRE53_04010 [Acaryochloris sp. 'Moss Beach']
MANSMMVIAPYRYEEMWVFDDLQAGLVQEPFVSGIPQMIDRLVIDIPEADQGFKLIFAQTPFPGYQAQLEWLRPEFGGHWYRWSAEKMDGWLCPALFKYFADAPPQLFCQAEAKSHDL